MRLKKPISSPSVSLFTSTGNDMRAHRRFPCAFRRGSKFCGTASILLPSVSQVVHKASFPQLSETNGLNLPCSGERKERVFEDLKFGIELKLEEALSQKLNMV